jgi:tape measure domain-containing protein
MAAPQLRLEVSLNLAGFRNEVRKLTQIAQSEFNPLLKVNVDTKDYRAQLKALERIKPVIKIEDSQLDAARARIGTLNKSLATLRRATSTPIEIKLKYTEIGKPPSAAAGQIGSAVSGRVRADQAVAVLNQKQAIAARNMLKAADVPVSGLGKSRSLEAYRKSIIDGMTNAGKESIAGLTQALKDGQSAIGQAAKIVGQEGIRAIKDTLGIASPSREFKKIGEAAGQGFEQGLLSSMADAFDSLERQLGTKLQRLKAQAIAGTSGALAVSGRVSPVQVADVTPRDYARIAGSGPRAALPPGVDRSAETLQNFYRSLDQIGIALASTVDSAERAADAFKTLRNAIDSLINRAKVLTGEQSLQARLRPSSVPGGMPLLTGRAPSRALPMLSAAAQRPERFTSQEKLFKDFLGRTIKAVVPESGSAAIGRSLFGGTQFREIGNAMRRPQLGAGIGTKVETVAVKDLTIASRNIAAATNALKAQKLLPAAGGTSASQMIRQALSGLPPLKAPQIGAQNISPRGSLGQFPMAGMMAPSSPLGSMGQFPVDPMLAVGGASAMGQKVAGPYPWSNTARSARGGYIPGIGSSLQFPMSGMMGPSSPLGRITPQSSMFAGGGGGGPGGGGPGGGGPGGGGGGPLGGMQFNVPQLPGSGLVREIGTEFAFAARQVLLFGTAYKALAFLQGFPGQVGNAVGALQSFRNTLGAISPSAAEAAASSQFILDVVDKYNTPIQSARDGFTKLYASMKPTGFSGDEIRDLFLGISQAAATFGMSSDKVDRVNYAFAQMASKGQVMSEELKGQLGDVLPGAMGIFAEAAGFTGPEAITKFSKALEDGAYKGEAMKTLLTNVGLIMRQEFGPGAEGAARTFQGVINRMQNSLTLLYESFEPVAVGFLNAVVMPMTSGIKTVTDGFKAFFTGQAAQTAGGSVFAKQLEALRPAFEGIAANIKQILPLLQSFASTALSLGQALLQIAGNPFVGYLARIYLSVLPLTMALRVLNLQVLIPLIGSFLRAIPAFISFNAAMMSGVGTNRALIATMQLTGQTAGVTAGKIRLVSAALATLGSAAILAGIGLLIERFLMMKGAIDGVRQSTQQMLGSISGMANSGAVKELKNVGQDLQKQQTTFKELKSFVSGGTIAGGKERLTEAGAKKFEEVGMGSFVKKDVFGKPYIADFLRASEIIEEKLKGLDKQSSKVQEKLPLAAKVAADLAKQAQAAQVIAPIPEAPSDGTGKPPKEQSLESYYSLQDQLAKNFTQAEINRLQAMHDQRMALQNEFFNQQEARANSFQKESIKFQRELASIENERKTALLKASLEVMRAQGSVAGGAAPMGAATAGKTGLFQGSTGVSSGAHFDVRRQDGAYISPEQARALFDPSVRKQLAMTSAYGPRRAPVPGASTFHRGVDLAGPANTPLNLAAGYAMTGAGEKGGLGYAASVRGPQGEMYDVGHLQRPKAGAVAPRKVPGSEKRDLVAAQQVQIANSQQITTGLNAEELAYEKTKTAIANYVASIFSPEEQTLQNSLLAKRGELIRAGMDDDAIELEMKRYEIQQKVNIGLVDAKKALDEKKIGQKQYNDLVAQLNNLLPTSNKLLGEQNALLKDNAYGKRIEDLKEQIRLLLIINTEERRLAELTKEFDGDAIKAQEIFNLEKIKKNIEETRALIDGFVSSTTSDYKGFLKAVISGEDAADALKQFQEGLKDKVLTIFLDFAMAPVEKFLKESLEGLFLPKAKKEDGKLPEATTKDPVEATNINTTATNANTTEIKNLTTAIQGMGAGTNATSSIQGPTAGNAFSPGGILPPIAPGFDAASVFGNPEALTSAFAGIQSSISTSMEGITSSFQMGADSLANTLPSWSDALTTKLPAALNTSTNNTEGEIPAFQESLGKVASGIGIAAGAIMGIAAGISQIKKGGTGNTLMGIGSIMGSIGGAIGGFTKLAGANGGVAGGGWKPFPVSAFANGGMVKGPTLGLVGEGKYNEAIVPLPDGRSIPVQMRGGGGSGSRDLLANQAQSRPSPSVLSMSFQSTTINGVEYVDRAQLEAAMEETRRAASREGANKGANLAIDRLANSPSSRRRAGIR